MLVGRRMEHHLWMVFFKNFPHTDGVFHVGDDEGHAVFHPLEVVGVVHLELEVVHGRLGLVEHDEFGGVVVHHLTANLAADAAGSTRDEHHLVVDFADDVALAEDDRFAAQKVLDLDVLDLVGRQLAVHPFVERGDGFHDEVERHSLLDDFLLPFLSDAGNGQNHHVDVVFFDELGGHGHLGRVHFDGVDLRLGAFRVVVNKGLHLEFRVGVLAQCAQQHGATVAGAIDEHVHLVARVLVHFIV